MKSIYPRLGGTLFITMAVFSVLFRVLAGSEFTLMPWPVALIALAFGLLLLRHGRNLARDEADRKDHA